MGSGDRIKFTTSETLGLGLYASRFPFALTIGVHVLMWHLTIGFGKGYDQ